MLSENHDEKRGRRIWNTASPEKHLMSASVSGCSAQTDRNCDVSHRIMMGTIMTDFESTSPTLKQGENFVEPLSNMGGGKNCSLENNEHEF